MAVTKLKLKQVENSSTPGSIPAYDASNILSIVAPTTGADRIPFYDDSATAMAFLTLGTNLSISGTTINATAGAGGYSEILEDGVTFTNGNTNTKINFTGSGLTATDGGAGVTTVAVNTFLNTLATAGTVLLSSGNISGTLAVANGGTGATTLTGLLQGNGTGAITGITNSSTVGQVLRVTGASTYAWGALDLADTDAITGDLPFANLAQGAGLSVLGVNGTGSADVASISAVSDHEVLRRSGSSLGFGAVNLASSNAVTGVLDETNGGTGQSTITTGDILYGSSSNTLSKLSIGAASTYLKGGTTPSWATLNIAALSDGGTIATQTYVNNLIAGIRKGSVRVASTINGTLATAFANGQVVDTVTLVTGDLILLKNQTTQAENGVYTVNASGAPTRATWMDAAAEIDGVYVAVEDGSQAGTLWITVSEVTTLGTDAIVFTQIQTSGTVLGSAGVTNTLAFWSSSNTIDDAALSYTNGSVFALGTVTNAANTILTTKGTDSTNSAFGILHQNSGGNQVFKVSNTGVTTIGASNQLVITNNVISNASVDLTIAGASNVLFQSGGTAATGYQATFDTTRTPTTGATGNINLTGSFTSTSTATNTQLAITSSVVQTGGGTGIARGVHIAPAALTNAADYRGLEITASASHYAIYTTAGKVRHDLGSDATGDTWYRGAGGEMVRLAAGATSGHVLTSNGAGAAPSWQATATATVVTRAYLTGSTASVIDLDSGTAVTDIDGTNVAFTTSGLSADQIFVVRNGVTLSQSGTVSRDYTLVPGTGVLTLATALSTDESLLVYKIV